MTTVARAQWRRRTGKSDHEDRQVAIPDSMDDLLVLLRRLCRALTRELAAIPEDASDQLVRAALKRALARLDAPATGEEQAPMTAAEVDAWEAASRRLVALVATSTPPFETEADADPDEVVDDGIGEPPHFDLPDEPPLPPRRR